MLFNTPLLIGMNWLMLTYAGSSMTETMSVPGSLKILFASLIMVAYDLILEQMAPTLDMWYWENNSIPLQNYLSWFVVSLVFQTFMRISGVRIRNPVAPTILLIQMFFFISLILLYKYIL